MGKVKFMSSDLLKVMNGNGNVKDWLESYLDDNTGFPRCYAIAYKEIKGFDYYLYINRDNGNQYSFVIADETSKDYEVNPIGEDRNGLVDLFEKSMKTLEEIGE